MSVRSTWFPSQITFRWCHCRLFSIRTHGETTARLENLQIVRGNRNGTALDREALSPCIIENGFRPVFERQRGLYKNVRGNTMDVVSMDRVRFGRQDWFRYAEPRLKGSGVYGRLLNRPAGHTDSDEPAYITNKPMRSSPPLFLWVGCRTGFINGVSARVEIEARKFCAQVKDERYPWVYHDLAYQAHVLYLIGRIEFETSHFAGLAAHILRIAAGLGQLDAALLLHQIEKANTNIYTLHMEQRAVIAKAAEQQLDWRAMVAHCEYLVSKAKRRNGTVGKARLPSGDLQECLDLLTAAMRMTGPDLRTNVRKELPPPTHFDADVVGRFDPPYKLLLDITATEFAAGNNSRMITKTFDDAALVGVYQYKDPIAATWYFDGNILSLGPYDSHWIHCAEVAARNADDEACFRLGKHYLECDGWYPSLTKRVTDMVDRRFHEDLERSKSEGTYNARRMTEREKHDLIMGQRDDRLLNKQEGLEWMKTAGQLNLNHAGRMMNRYCIAAGILRQNGFLVEGRQVLSEAEEALKESVDRPQEIARVRQVLREYMDYWDSRPVHDLLTPEEIGKLLGPPKKRAAKTV